AGRSRCRLVGIGGSWVYRTWSVALTTSSSIARPGATHGKRAEWAVPLMAYLHEIRTPHKPVSAAALADLLRSFRCYLTVERRLVAGRVDNDVQLARRFLDFCAHQGVA